MVWETSNQIHRDQGSKLIRNSRHRAAIPFLPKLRDTSLKCVQMRNSPEEFHTPHSVDTLRGFKKRDIRGPVNEKRFRATVAVILVPRSPSQC
ncbi:hypothetical protein FJTKL_01461 [Diaporthe vaccinii]|uniref:Uncharacterized protein n=1 Tax=Diaporthe vaccinii TaxID=105482 RepID=A0ABR4E0H5_9PEZI